MNKDKIDELEVNVIITSNRDKIKAKIPENITLIELEKVIYSLINYSKINLLMNDYEFRCFIEAVEICIFSSHEEIEKLLKRYKN